MKKTRSFFLTLILITSVVFFSGGVLLGHFYPKSEIKSPTDFSEVQKIIEQFIAAPSSQATRDALTHAYVQSYGDKYTQYFSPDEVLSFQTMIDGDFEGIGAYVEGDINGVYISGVLPGSPAQQSGLLPGDIIQSVDGETMHAKTPDEAVRKIRGPAGTPVVLEVFSTVTGTKKQVTLLRKKLEIPIITDELKENILIIHLFSFNDHSRDDVQKVLEKHAGKYTSLLLDLRNNGGGTLQSAVDVASLFLQSGKTVATVDGQEPKKYVSHGSKDFSLPLFILVNGQTASAAEILASTLHVHLKAPLLGSQTYGKGSVQQLFPLSNGGELKVTIAHWHTADNIVLDGTGLTPTVTILPTVEDITSAVDGQLQDSLKYVSEKL